MPELSPEEPYLLDRRRMPREKTLQRVDILLGDSVHGCRLLDLNRGGARLELAIPLVLPDRFTLRLPDGRQVVCERRWRVGLRIGVAILAGAAVGGQRLERALSLQRMLEAMQSERFFGALRSENFFEDAAIGENTWAAEAALNKLGAALYHLTHNTQPISRPDAPAAGATPPADRKAVR